MPSPERIDAFRATVWSAGVEHHRDFPWRETHDPYRVLVSEIMLQQTQAPRVVPKYLAFVELFPTADALAAAPLPIVLESWQGLGYNRRAVALKRAAETVSRDFGGEVPSDEAELRSLPGVGPATAAGVRAFAFGLPSTYLETNIRAVILHEFFADADNVSDRDVVPLVTATLDEADPRGWYWAMLDYGAYLKRTMPNPSRRSAHHSTQSKFEGSRRQMRAQLLRAVMAAPGRSDEEYAEDLASLHTDRDVGDVRELLEELAAEGFLTAVDTGWSVAE